MDEPLSDDLVTEGPIDESPNSGTGSERETSQPSSRAPSSRRRSGSSRSVAAKASATPEDHIDKLLVVACTPGLSHGAFRLYVVLANIAHKKDSHDRFFPITLNGVQRVHPGTTGKTAGVSTIFKQIAELKAIDLLDMRAALHREEPDLPVLVKVLPPKAGEVWQGRKSALRWEATDGTWLTTSDVVQEIDMQ